MGYNVIGMRNSKGFTLVELLITIALVAILSGSVLYLSVSGNLKKGRDGRRKADLESIRSALEIYRSDCGTYPGTVTFGGSVSGACPTSQVYMQTVPNDPLSTQIYTYSKTGTFSYLLCANLEVVVGAYCVSNP